MMLTILNNQRGVFFDQVLFKKAVKLILEKLKVSGKEITISFVSAPMMQKLNKEHRKKDYVTDVLSFPMGDEIFTEILGDIIICPRKARIQANEIGNTLDEEMVFLAIHGILHLIGHDHEEASEEAVMLAKQQELKDYLSGKLGLWR